MDITWLLRHRPAFLSAAVLAPLAVAALLATVRSDINTATAVLVLVLVVVAASATGDRTAGFLAALSSGVWFDLFLLPPYGTLAINDLNDVEAVALLVLVGAAVTELALWGRRQQAQASRRSGYLDGVLSTAEEVAERQPAQADLIHLVTAKIVEILGVDGCRYLEEARVTTAAIERDGSVVRSGHQLNVQRDGLPIDDEIGLAIRNGGVQHGMFLITAASRVSRPSAEQLRVAVLLADQVGSLAGQPGPR